MEWRTALNTSNNSFSQASQEGCFYFEVNLSTESYWEIIHTITAAINSIFAISSVLGNSLILYVIWKNPSLHNPSNTLLGCLAFSDFFVGFLAQPAFVAHKIGELTSNFPLYCKTRVATETVGMITSGVSILTLAAISIERYLALKLNLRYKALVTISRMLYTVGSFWVIMSLVTALKILPNMKTASDTIIFAILVASFILILVSYAKILRCVIRHQNAINSEQVFVQSERNIEDLKDEKTEKVQRTFSLLRYKKSTISMAYILGFYLIFYMPFIVTLVAKKFVGYTRVIKASYVCTSTLVFLNSSVNPVIYCWRMSDIRSAAKKTLRKLRCSKAQEIEVAANGITGSVAPYSAFNRNISVNISIM